MNNKRQLLYKNSDDYNIDPIDFNPSLYPSTKKTKVAVTNTTNNSNNSLNSHHWFSHQKQQFQSNNNHYNNNHYHHSNNQNMSFRKSSKSNRNTYTVDRGAIDKMFNDFASEDDSDIADMEGISKLAEKLNIDPLEDIRILVLLHKLGSKVKPGMITRDEWMSGCESLNVDSIAKFQALLPSLDTGFMVDKEFRDFYKFCFQFNREGTHKTLEKDVVIALVEMTIKGRVPDDRLSSFIEFLNQTKDTSYNTITLDQWMSFLDFSKECHDLNEYNEDESAWPVLIDDYVDFATSMQM